MQVPIQSYYFKYFNTWKLVYDRKILVLLSMFYCLTISKCFLLSDHEFEGTC